jgi:hypothetical protein
MRLPLYLSLRSGGHSLSWVLDHADVPVVGRQRVADVLHALPQRVPNLAETVMEIVGISPNRRVRGLGRRQRTDLLGLDAAGVFNVERPAGRSSTPPRWDFFVSTGETYPEGWAAWIAWHLREAGYRVLLKKWDAVSGSDWGSLLRDGLEHSTRTIAVLSADFARQAARGTAEWQIALWTVDPAEAARRLLVARVADCALPGLLGQVPSFDLFDLEEAEATAVLLRAAEQAIARPEVIPNAALGDHEAARTLDEDTLERRRRVLGADHPDTLTSAHNLATDGG